jgi:hypothetical protein
MLRNVLGVAAALVAWAAGADEASARYRLWVEAGPVWQGRNNVQIPNDANGTRFSIEDAVGSGPFPSVRADLSWRLKERQELRFLVAPLSFEEDGVLPGTTKFNGATFAGGTATAFKYQFNSYRITWRYTVYDQAGWVVKLGVTGNVRDAEIALKQGGVQSSKTNTGFVPLLHANAERQLGERWRLILDLDGLGAPQGRAIDFSVQAGYDFSPRFTVAAGWRVIDGGGDNDDVYNFARFDFASLSAMWRF